MDKNYAPLISGLPDDVSLLCLSRVPTDVHRSLLLVSKSWLHAFSSGKVYETRKSLNLLEKHLVISVGVEHTDPSTPGLKLSKYNPANNELHSFTTIELRNPKIFNKNFCCISLDSDVYFLPFRDSDFSRIWVLRVKFQRMEFINCPYGDIWAMDFVHPINGRLFFGKLDYDMNSKWIKEVKLIILGENGKWIEESYNFPTTRNREATMMDSSVLFLENKLYFQSQIPLGTKTLAFDLEDLNWTIEDLHISKFRGCIDISRRSYHKFAYVKGVLFRAFINEDHYYEEVEEDYVDFLRLQKFDKRRKFWYDVDRLDEQTELVEMKVIGDSLYVITIWEGEEEDSEEGSFPYALSIFKTIQNEEGELVGDWDVVNLKLSTDWPEGISCCVVQI